MANDEKLLKIISHYRKKLQKKIKQMELPVEYSNYFVKKAEIELAKNTNIKGFTVNNF